MRNLIASTVLGTLAAAALIVGVAGAPAFAQESKPAPGSKEHPKPAKEAQVDKHDHKAGDKNVHLHVGESAPDFTGKDLDGKEHKLSDLTKAGKTVVLVWFNPDCPYVKKHFENGNNTFQTMADKFKGKEVVVLAINSGAKGKQGTGAERNEKARKDWKITIPVILDEAGTIGKAYGAKNSPATYVVGKDGKLAYTGALDDDSGSKGPGKTNYAMNAVEELLAGKAVTMSETKPYGCGVKYAE